MSPKCRETFVARSKGAPISVIVSTDLDEAPSGVIIPEMGLLLGQSYRLESVSITSSTDTAEYLLATLKSPAPRLKSLEVHIIHDYHPDDIEKDGTIVNNRLFDANAPLLRRFSFTNCSLPWTSSLYRGAASITHKFDGRMPPFTSRELVRGLRVLSHSLQELELSFYHDFNKTLARDGPIPLPKLKSLSLGRTMQESINLLPLLQLDTSTSLKLQCDWANVYDMEVISGDLSLAWLSAPLSGPSFPGPPTIERLSLINSADTLVIKGWTKAADGKTQEEILSISSDKDRLGRRTRAIVGQLPLYNLIGLELQSLFRSSSALEEILSRTPLLKSITFSEHISEGIPFLSFLAEDPSLEEPEDGASIPLEHRTVTRLPCLQEISFRHVEDDIAPFLLDLAVPLRERGMLGSSLKKITFRDCAPIAEYVVEHLKDGTGLEDVAFQ